MVILYVLRHTCLRYIRYAVMLILVLVQSGSVSLLFRECLY